MPPVKLPPRETLPPLGGFVSEGAYESFIASPSALPLFDVAHVQDSVDDTSTTDRWLPPHLHESTKSWARVTAVLKLLEASEV